MKVTVSFNTVKIVVPCGDGELTVRELKQLATTRYCFENSCSNFTKVADPDPQSFELLNADVKCSDIFLEGYLYYE